MGTPEGFILDPNGSSPLNLGNNGSLRLAGLTVPPAPKRPEWASNADTDGNALIRNPLHDNRSCTMQVRVHATSMDAAMTAIGTLEGKLQEACIQGANNGPGLAFSWTPSGATHALTGYMLYAEITDLPVTYDDGWFASQPIVTVTFQAKPFLYGTEVTGPTASGTTPLLTVEVDSVPGDVAAEARLVVTDGTAQPRRWVEWGLESLYYDAASPAPLFVDSGSLITSGFAGAGSALTGAYGGSVVAAPLYTEPIALCGTGNLSNVGVFRVKARINAASSSEFWRLSWQVGDDDFTPNDYAQPVVGGDFNEVDLGIVTIEEVQAGTQTWSAHVEAYTTTSAGERGAIDYLALLPAEEGYGRLQGGNSYAPAITTNWDNFTAASVSGTVLNGRVAPTGGTWATSGSASDFGFSSTTIGGDADTVTGTDSGFLQRFGVLGGTLTDTVVAGYVWWVNSGSPPGSNVGLIARYVNTTNYLVAYLDIGGEFFLKSVVSGVSSTIASDTGGLPLATTYKLQLAVYATGRVTATVQNLSGGEIKSLEGISSVLATGGTLASGKAGIFDAGEHVTRLYDNISVGTPAAESFVINSGKSLQVRSNSNLRQSADGSRYGDIPSRGSRLFIPEAGDAGRSTRIAVRVTREDPITMASRNDGDTTQLAVFYTPRYLAVPRS